MNLVIDLGNTFHKVAVVGDGEIIELQRYQILIPNHLDEILSRFPLEKAIISSVVENDSEIRDWLRKNLPFVEMDTSLKFPFAIDYEMRETLGTDRIAASVGGRNLFPQGNLLVIQAGSCITFDFVDANNFYRGGSISPGILMRLKALNHYTGKLPEMDFEIIDSFVGNSTKKSILAGVTCGIASEIDGMIQRYNEKYENLTVILTGGAINYFDKWLKNSNFANPNLVIEGLNTILNIND
jgi:type III pantothenate kinase